MIRFFRWLFHRRGLDDILSGFDEMKEELNMFCERTEEEIEEQRAEIERLQAEHNRKIADRIRARVVSSNIETILTRQLEPDCEVNV